MITRDNFPSLVYQIKGYYDEVFFSQADEIPSQIETIFNVKGTTKAREHDQELIGFGQLHQKAEGAPIDFEDAAEGYAKTYEFPTWALGYKMTQEALEDEQFGKFDQLTEQLARSARYTKEAQSAIILNQAFSTSATYAGPDGLPLCSIAHILKGTGGTAANRPTTASSLTIASYQAALTRLTTQVTENGLKARVRPAILVYDPTREFKAEEILKSSLKPETADNEVNAAARLYTVRGVRWDFLTASGAWFLLAQKREHKLKWYDRRALKTEMDRDPNTTNILYHCSQRHGGGFTNWHGVDGNPGS